MIQVEINEIYNRLLEELQEEIFPISMQNIIKLDFIDDFIKHYFKIETEYYCTKLLTNIINNTCIDEELIKSEDYYQLQQIIFDWVRFDAANTEKILLTALQLQINYIFSPINTINKFIFAFCSSNNEQKQEKLINNILEELNFFDKDYLLSALQEELLDLQNEKKKLTCDEFNDLVRDIFLNTSQNLGVNEFLLPLKKYFEVVNKEFISLKLLINYFANRDLTGIVGEISNYATKNNLIELDYSQIIEILEKLFGVADGIPPTSELSALENSVLALEEHQQIDNNKLDYDTNTSTSTNTQDTIQESESELKDDFHDEILEKLYQMRDENKTSFEIEIKYLELEKENIEKIKNKIENL